MPGTNSSVSSMSIDFTHGAERMPVIAFTSAAGWFTPGCGSECQIGRYMELLQDRSARRLIGRRAREVCPANGAAIAAATIQSVLGCR